MKAVRGNKVELALEERTVMNIDDTEQKLWEAMKGHQLSAASYQPC